MTAHPTCGQLRFWIGDDHGYCVQYRAMDAANEVAGEKEKMRLYERSLIGGGGDLCTMRTVTSLTIGALAECLRGNGNTTAPKNRISRSERNARYAARAARRRRR